MPYLKALAELGLVLFMFIVGLQLDLALLRGHQRRAATISDATPPRHRTSGRSDGGSDRRPPTLRCTRELLRRRGGQDRNQNADGHDHEQAGRQSVGRPLLLRCRTHGFCGGVSVAGVLSARTGRETRRDYREEREDTRMATPQFGQNAMSGTTW